MKVAAWIVVLAFVGGVVGLGGWVYSKCGGFNNCLSNPVCQHDCYENGVRVR